MTAEELQDLKHVRRALDRIEERQERMNNRVKRVEISLVGDGEMGSVGLVHRLQTQEADLQALQKQVADLVRMVEPIVRATRGLMRFIPHTLLALFVFSATGGDLKVVVELIARIFK